MTDYPYRPDHVDAAVTAMHADRRALLSQLDTRPRYDTRHEPPQEPTDD